MVFVHWNWIPKFFARMVGRKDCSVRRFQLLKVDLDLTNLQCVRIFWLCLGRGCEYQNRCETFAFFATFHFIAPLFALSIKLIGRLNLLTCPPAQLSKTFDLFTWQFIMDPIRPIRTTRLVHPQYILRDPSELQHIASSIQVIRVSDNASFLASKIPNVVTKDLKKETTDTKLANAILPTA